MPIKIGHAVGSENPNDRNGRKNQTQPGDQTKKEVYISTWYKKPWKVLRHHDAKVREKMAQKMKAACNNDNIGYSQLDRNTLHDLLVKNGYKFAKVGKCETDCSALVTACAIGAGVVELEYTGNAPVTANMIGKFQKAGFELLTESRYTDSDQFLVRGDILVNEGSHTCMVLEDGPGKDKYLRHGSVGMLVEFWQTVIEQPITGLMSNEDVKETKEWQAANGLEADGIVGRKTMTKAIDILFGD